MTLKTPMQQWAINHAIRKRNVLVLIIMCAVIETALVPLLKLVSVEFNWQLNEILCSVHYVVPILVLGYFLLATYWVWLKDNLELNQALKQSAWE